MGRGWEGPVSRCRLHITLPLNPRSKVVMGKEMGFGREEKGEIEGEID